MKDGLVYIALGAVLVYALVRNKKRSTEKKIVRVEYGEVANGKSTVRITWDDGTIITTDYTSGELADILKQAQADGAEIKQITQNTGKQ